MSYDATESATLSFSAVAEVPAFFPNTDQQNGRCDAYDLPLSKTAGRERNQRREPDRKSVRAPNHAAVVSQSRRYSLGLHLRRARSLIKSLTTAVNGRDDFGVADSGISLSNELNELWKLRDLREAEWASVLNFLQSALAKEDFERFQSEQCDAIRNVVEEVLAAGVVDDEDVGRVRRTLRDAGLDPWKAISQQDE